MKNINQNKKKKILYIFRGKFRDNVFKDAINNFANEPTEFLYGLNLLDKNKYDIDYIVAPREGRKELIRKITFLLEKPFHKITKLALPIEIYPLFRKKLKQSDILICVNDQISFGILFWKLFGLLKNKKVICIIMSLPEKIKYFSWCHSMRWFVSKMLKKAFLILTLSKYVQKDLINKLKLSPNKINTFYFGVDNTFWKPLHKNKEENFILSIGNDMNRDFKTLVGAFPNDINLKIITKKQVNIQNKKIEIISGISNAQLRELYNKCLFVVVPSIKLQNESSGLSCALQAMACGKATIISKAPPLEELFKDNKHCLFYEPENSEDLRKKIKTLLENNYLRKKIAENSLTNTKKFTNKKMAKKLEEIINNIKQ